jgi:hypothetical protein
MDVIGDRRKVSDSEGHELTVFESGKEGDQCLFFDCINSVRRVRQYPVLWRDLSDVELFALSWTR